MGGKFYAIWVFSANIKPFSPANPQSIQWVPPKQFLKNVNNIRNFKNFKNLTVKFGLLFESFVFPTCKITLVLFRNIWLVPQKFPVVSLFSGQRDKMSHSIFFLVRTLHTVFHVLLEINVQGTHKTVDFQYFYCKYYFLL